MISKSSSSNSFDSSKSSAISFSDYMERAQHTHSLNSLFAVRSLVEGLQFGVRTNAIRLKTEAIHAVSLLQRF